MSGSGKHSCAKCGAELAAFATEGFCSACLLEKGLEADPGLLSLSRFGDYELIEEIARGGMGVVYKARQVSLDRIVAVKMIVSGRFATEAEIQRFRSEARAAATLHHPGIVAIHEVGEQEGHLYYSMDYVEGGNLAELVREGPLPPARAAQLVKTIAEAIHHAHKRGILHRDLKPSNVLLDSEGQPRVADFGLAKRLTTDTDLTLTGQVLGSPNFMPPEQAAGKHRELTAGADVYSMGALLYHLLTGRAPFLADSVPATLRLVVETEPVAPRLLTPTVPADLETICLKCLEKDRQRRYSTAKELRDELDRFLRNEPIQARPIGAPGRLWRWSRRNPGLARTAVAALVLLLIVVVGSPIALFQINHARQRAETRQKEATLEAIRSQQYAQFLKNMLRSAGPSVARGRDATLLRELLANTAEQVEKDLGDQPEVQGDILFTLGNTYRDIGDYQRAIPVLEKAVSRYREAFGGAHKKLALALGQLGNAQSFTLDLTTGRRNAESGVAMARQCGDQETLATCLFNVAGSLQGSGRNSLESLPYIREALELRRNMGDKSIALADCLRFMAGTILDGNGAEAEKLARESLALYSERLAPDHPSVVSGIFMLGQVQLARGNFADAELTLKETLQLYRKVHDQRHPYRSIVLRLLGEALTKQGKTNQLEDVYQEDLASYGADHPPPWETVSKLSTLLQEQGKVVEADEVLQQHLTKLRKNPGSNGMECSKALNALAKLADRQNKSEDATNFRREALESQRKYLEHQRKLADSAIESNPQNGTAWRKRAEIFARAGRWKDAEADLARAIQLTPEDAMPYSMMAQVLIADGQSVRYGEVCRQMLARFGNTQTASVADRVAKGCLVLPPAGGDLARAAELADIAVTSGQNSEYLPWFQLCRALADYRRGRFLGAIEWANKPLSSSARLPERDAAAFLVVTMAQQQLTEDSTARISFDKAKKVITEKLPKLNAPDLGVQWEDRLIVDILWREAQALMEGKRSNDGAALKTEQ